MTVEEAEPEIQINDWRADRSAGLYSNVNGLYIQARKQELGFLVKLEFKWADENKTTYATFVLREHCHKESGLDEAATKIYKKLHAMLLALEPFKDTE